MAVRQGHRLLRWRLCHQWSSPMIVPGLLVLILQALTDQLCGVIAAPASNRDRVVYWNASNPLFQPVGENVLTVSLQDRINLVCPNNGVEFYQIYWTPNPDHITACSGGNFLFDCRTMESYLVYVQIFPADPTAPGFLNPVYFYTPSRGDLIGLEQTSGGACQSRNMRVTVRTGDAATTSKSPAVSNSTTRSFPANSSSSSSSPAAATSHPTSDGHASAGSPIATKSRTTPVAVTEQGASYGSNLPATTSVGARETERVDYARINLITGSSVAMPTAVMVTGLACLSVSAARLLTL